MDKQEQIGVAVAALLDQDKMEHLEWVKGILAAAQSERLSWEGQAATKSVEEPADAENESTASRPVEWPSIGKAFFLFFLFFIFPFHFSLSSIQSNNMQLQIPIPRLAKPRSTL